MNKVTDSKMQGQAIQVVCPQCEKTTKHIVERAIEWSGYIDGPDIRAWATYQIVRCNGCDTLSFRSIHTNSEDLEYNDAGELVRIETETLYPERKKRSVIDELYLRDDVYEIPEIIQVIYRETLSAVQHDLPTLAGVGIRAVIEATCQNLTSKKRNLAGRIDELVGKSLLTPAGAEILHGIRLLGNDAAHEIKAPKAKQIKAALKVIDHLLLGVYVLPQEASVLPKPVPKPALKAIALPAAKSTEMKLSTGVSDAR
jgi:hypothetical protein